MSSNKIILFSQPKLWNACLGNLFEHYDSALFGFLSPFLAPLIFPNQDPTVALILTYALIPLGMLARPIGGFIFGHIGDVYGREQALFLSLSGMAVVSGIIALSPTYEQAGLLSPIIFCLGRVMQNFFSSGETMGGAILLLENSCKKQHDILSGIYSASTIAGILLASTGVYFLTLIGSINHTWRLLYFFGFITAFFGGMLRKEQCHNQTKPSNQLPHHSFAYNFTIFWEHRKSIGVIAIAAGFSYANFTIAFVLLNGFIPLISPLTKVQMMGINTPLLLLDFIALPIFGWIATKIAREKLMLIASLLVSCLALPLFMMIKTITLPQIVAIRIIFIIIGVSFFAPFHAWAQTLIPPKHRYIVISLAYSLGSQLLGGPTATISLWLYKKTGLISSVAWYWTALSLAASFIFAKNHISNLIGIFAAHTECDSSSKYELNALDTSD